MKCDRTAAFSLVDEAFDRMNKNYSCQSVVYPDRCACDALLTIKTWLQGFHLTTLNDYRTRRVWQVCRNELQPVPDLNPWPGPTTWPDAGLYIEDLQPKVAFDYAAAEKAAKNDNPFALQLAIAEKKYKNHAAYAAPMDILGYLLGGGGGLGQQATIQNYQQTILQEYVKPVDDKLLEYLKNQQAAVVEWTEKQDPKNFSADAPPPEPEPPPTIEQPIPFKRKFS